MWHENFENPTETGAAGTGGGGELRECVCDFWRESPARREIEFSAVSCENFNDRIIQSQILSTHTHTHTYILMESTDEKGKWRTN